MVAIMGRELAMERRAACRVLVAALRQVYFERHHIAGGHAQRDSTQQRWKLRINRPAPISITKASAI